MKSISKYCTLSFTSRNSLKHAADKFSAAQFPAVQSFLWFRREQELCFTLWDWRCIWDMKLRQLSSELGHGRWEGHQEQKHLQWEGVPVLVQMTLRLGRVWMQALTVRLVSDGRGAMFPALAGHWPRPGRAEPAAASASTLAGLQKHWWAQCSTDMRGMVCDMRWHLVRSMDWTGEVHPLLDTSSGLPQNSGEFCYSISIAGSFVSL